MVDSTVAFLVRRMHLHVCHESFFRMALLTNVEIFRKKIFATIAMEVYVRELFVTQPAVEIAVAVWIHSERDWIFVRIWSFCNQNLCAPRSRLA